MRQLEGIEYPLYLSVLSVATVIVSQEELVGEEGGQELCLVVVESAVPDVVGEFEGVLEPFVKRLHGFAPACITLLPAGALEEVESLAALSAASPSVRGFTDGGFAAAGLKRPDEAASVGPVLEIAFNGLLAGVAVIAAVGQDVSRGPRQLGGFVEEASALTGVGGVGGGQERKDGRMFCGGDDMRIG